MGFLREKVVNMKIGTKLMAGFMSVVVLLLISNAIAYYSLNTVAQSVDTIKEHSDELELVADLQLALDRVIMPANDYLITGDTTEKENFTRLSAQMEDALKKAEGIKDLTEQERALLKDVREDYAQLQGKALAILAIPNPVGNLEGGRIMEEMDAMADDIISDAEDLHQIERGQMTEAQSSAVKIRNTATIALIVAIGLALAASLTIGISISRSITSSVVHLSQAANVISTGDLTQEIEVKSQDELGQLTLAFNRMAQELRNLIGQAIDTAQRLSTSAEELSSASEEMNVSAEQVTSTVQEIAHGAQVQAEQVQATSKSMEEMATSSRQIAANAELTGSASLQARETVSNAAQALEALGRKSQEINRIVTIVEKFADQTSLLALNAAIEAARAGEHGKGFAVVADEVGRLAESSGRSVGEIATLSAEIQAEMNRLVASMEEVIEAVGKAAELAEETSTITQQQEASSEMVVKAVGEVASVAEENASATEEVAGAMEEQTASMEEIAASAEELAGMAEQLQALVASFKVA